MSPTTVLKECRVCEHHGQQESFEVKEMMSGTREEFDYFKCRSCGCLQIAEIPADLSRYYSQGYYSFGIASEGERPGRLQRWLQKQRVRTALFARGYRVNEIAKRFATLPEALHRRHGGLPTGEVLKKAGVSSLSSRCLDVGCGEFSKWLHHLWLLGFDNRLGVDPYIEGDRHHGPVPILKRELVQVNGRFDFITFHHSLEHIADQAATLRAALERLAPGGTLLVRVPLVSSLAWERYEVNWVELDAPRHLYLHSIDSLTRTAQAVGLKLLEVVHDSVPLEFYGSELYAHDIPLVDPRFPAVDEASTYFSIEEMAEFAALAERVNSEGRGGRAGFYFRAER